ncbi:DNA-binding transcriptional LysR family regulator [Pseudoduganella flava]|uniref:DNA-binding transcriptional LysR family regulator n=1 Tax=Pseudoduganella flava TaxID=871742 RepID=A0A562Q5X8_9BURK|nr:LysR substrate-binding domain-containing protein [Pseudoduganella flava]QGZ41605.1 LysR family transcriptional regulator [Pseudoduganella flava]TWI51590.1 DNA-binding transcriptional LysR family regulator [Pseudoduganella flava]
MELRHLRYFVAVAEELSFTRAAERLHIGQPPLSQQIQALELDMGARLFERTKRSVRLTEAGKLFLVDARRVLALAEQAKETARRAQLGEAGELRVGFTFSTPFTPLFAKVVRRYRQQYPGVLLTFHELATLPQLAKLEARELDLGFVRSVSVAIPDTVTLTELRHDPLRLVLPADSPLAKKKKVAVKDLEGLPFVVFPQGAGTGIYPQIFRLCRAAGFTPQIAMEAGEASTIIGLVAAGCGISVLPSSFEGIHMEGVVYRPLADPAATTSLLLARRSDDGGPLVDAFVALAEAAAAEE